MLQEFVQSVTDTIQKELKGVHTVLPGTIVAFDPAKMVATVLPKAIFKKPNGEVLNYPQTTGVPVVIPQGAAQQATIAYPIKAGDSCLILYAEQSLDYWMYGQMTSTELKFDLTNAICIPGLFTTPNEAVKKACAENAVVVDAKGTRVIVKQDNVEIEAKNVTIKSEKATIESKDTSIKAETVKIDGDLEVTGSVKAEGGIED